MTVDDYKTGDVICQECGLVLGSKPELVDHIAYIHTGTKHDKLPESKDVVIIEEVLEDNSGKNGKPIEAELCLTIHLFSD